MPVFCREKKRQQQQKKKQSARKKSLLISNSRGFKALLNKTTRSKREPQSWFHIAGHSISFPMLIKVMVMQSGGNGSQSPLWVRPQAETLNNDCECQGFFFFWISTVTLSRRPDIGARIVRPTLETERRGTQDHSSRTCSVSRSTEKGVEGIHEEGFRSDRMAFFSNAAELNGSIWACF